MINTKHRTNVIKLLYLDAYSIIGNIMPMSSSDLKCLYKKKTVVNPFSSHSFELNDDQKVNNYKIYHLYTQFIIIFNQL